MLEGIKMNTTIILAHPWHGSYNKAIVDTIIKTLEDKKESYQIIDLNKDNFNPVLTQNELALYSKGEHLDPLVSKYQKILLDTKRLVIIFPIWWGSTPAVLKGFFDKVLLKGFAYHYIDNKMVGMLKNIEKCFVITTSETPNEYLKNYFGNIIENQVIKFTLDMIGVQNSMWINKDLVVGGGVKSRHEFLDKITQLF